MFLPTYFWPSQKLTSYVLDASGQISNLRQCNAAKYNYSSGWGKFTVTEKIWIWGFSSHTWQLQNRRAIQIKVAPVLNLSARFLLQNTKNISFTAPNQNLLLYSLECLVASVRLWTIVTNRLTYDPNTKAKEFLYNVPSRVAWTVTNAICALLVLFRIAIDSATSGI